MKVKRIWLAASLSLAVAAFAIPGSAAAEPGSVFVHEGNPIETPEAVTAEYEGTMEFELPNETGIHCPSITIEADLEGHGTGTVSSFTTPGTACTVFGGEANGFPVHTIPLGIHGEAPTTEGEAGWHLTAEPANDRIAIENLHIESRVTHPATPHLVIATSTIHGTLFANVDRETTDATTVTLSGNVTVNGTGTQLSGHLEEETDTHVGIAEG